MASSSYQRLKARTDVLEAALALQADPANALLKVKLIAALDAHNEVTGRDSLGGAVAKALAAGNQQTAVTTDVAKAAGDSKTVQGAIAKAVARPASANRPTNLAKASDFGKEPTGATHDLSARIAKRRKDALAQGKQPLDVNP